MLRCRCQRSKSAGRLPGGILQQFAHLCRSLPASGWEWRNQHSRLTTASDRSNKAVLVMPSVATDGIFLLSGDRELQQPKLIARSGNSSKEKQNLGLWLCLLVPRLDAPVNQQLAHYGESCSFSMGKHWINLPALIGNR